MQMIGRMTGVPHRSAVILFSVFLNTSHLVVVADDRKSSVRAAERSILSQLGSSSSVSLDHLIQSQQADGPLILTEEQHSHHRSSIKTLHRFHIQKTAVTSQQQLPPPPPPPVLLPYVWTSLTPTLLLYTRHVLTCLLQQAAFLDVTGW